MFFFSSLYVVVVAKHLKSRLQDLNQCFFFCSGLMVVMELGEEISREAKKARKTGGLAGSSSDESESESDASDNEESDNESSKFLSSGDDDDFNPFRDESSEDDEDGETV